MKTIYLPTIGVISKAQMGVLAICADGRPLLADRRPPTIEVVSVQPMGGLKVRLMFSDGSAGVRDFSSTAALDAEMVRPLKNPVFFAQVFVELGALTWPNGFDLDPIALHDRTVASGELKRLYARNKTITGCFEQNEAKFSSVFS